MIGKTLKALAYVGVFAAYVGIVAWLFRDFDRRHPPKPVAALVDTVKVRDTVYVHDTLRYAVARDRYRTLRETTTVHDTALVAAADTALARCDTALHAGDNRVAARDTLIRTLLAPRPRFDLTLEGTGSPVGALRPELRAEAAFRLTTRLDAIAVADARAHDGTEMRLGARLHLQH